MIVKPFPKLAAIMLLGSFVVSGNAIAETRYVSSVKAKLLEQPNFKAATLVQLSKGQAVEILKTKGIWLQASANNKTGWVSKFLVKATPPAERVTVLPGNENTELKDVRRRTSAITTAAAARGLAATARTESEAKHHADVAAVEYMESFKVTPAELYNFGQALTGGEK